MNDDGVPGWIYLIHFDRPYEHASHYTGWTACLEDRLRAHAQGRGSRLMAVIANAGIGWKVARTWQGTRNDERRMKRQGGASRRCPLCGVRPRREEKDVQRMTHAEYAVMLGVLLRDIQHSPGDWNERELMDVVQAAKKVAGAAETLALQGALGGYR